jgi:hypothetical protein
MPMSYKLSELLDGWKGKGKLFEQCQSLFLRIMDDKAMESRHVEMTIVEVNS